jgi:FixJ family two-component response regulator
MSADDARIYIVEDDPQMRDSLIALLRSVRQPADWFDSTEAFLRCELADGPACLVVDVRLPGRSGLDLQRELVKSGRRLPVVFITGHGDIPMSVTAMKAGAIEFLTKPFRDQDLLDAIQRGLAADRERRAELALMAGLQDRFDSLSPREREVMALVTAGLLNKQIAAEMEVSEVTVKVHRGHVMRKMQARSLPELVRYADRLAAASRKA